MSGWLVMYNSDTFTSVTGPFTDFNEAQEFRVMMERRFDQTFSIVNANKLEEEE